MIDGNVSSNDDFFEVIAKNTGPITHAHFLDRKSVV